MNYRQRRAYHVAVGLHPLGLALGPEGRTCRECDHHYTRRWDKTYHKCALFQATCGPASDISPRWPACQRFEPIGETPPCPE